MDTFNYRGIVLRQTDFSESSYILNIFTYEKGIISVIAKGVKNPKSKKHNLVSVFTEANFELNLSHNRYYLKEGDILNNNLKIREEIKKIYMGQLFFDIIENTLIKEEVNNEVYLLLSKSLIFLSNSNLKLTVGNMFLIKYISMIGYKPRLFECTKCETKKFKDIYFSNSLGGIVCQNHYNLGDSYLMIEEYIYLKSILIEVFENINNIKHIKTEKKIFEIIMNFIKYITEIRELKSYSNLKKLFGI